MNRFIFFRKLVCVADILLISLPGDNVNSVNNIGGLAEWVKSEQFHSLPERKVPWQTRG